MNTEGRAILRGFPSWKDSIWVFPSKTQGTHLDSYNFYGRVFLKAIKAAKLEDVTWHTLRHTFASRLAMNGHGDSTIAALLRHSGTTLVQRYAHLSPNHLNAAVEGIPSFGGKLGNTGEGQEKPSGSDTLLTKTVAGTVIDSIPEEGGIA